MGAGLDDVGVEGEPVHDGGGEPRVGEGVLPHAEKGALEAQAMEARFLSGGDHLEQQFGCRGGPG